MTHSDPEPRPHFGLKHAAITVTQLDLSLKFWKSGMGFQSYREKESDWAMVFCGDTTLSLVTQSYPSDSQQGQKGAQKIHHLGITVSSPDEVRKWHHKLSQLQADFPALKLFEPKAHRDESYGFYFYDIDGNPFEVIHIPVIPREGALLEPVILLGHGSRDPRWPLPILALQKKLRTDQPQLLCEVAWMEFAEPDLNQALSKIKANYPSGPVRVIPIFISAGGHVSHDLPELVAQSQSQFPEFRLQLETAIGEQEIVLEAMKTQILSFSMTACAVARPDKNAPSTRGP
jgi:sirohydrochlorin cobaltochelatase